MTKERCGKIWNALSRQQRFDIYKEIVKTPDQNRDMVCVMNFVNSEWDSLGGYNQNKVAKEIKTGATMKKDTELRELTGSEFYHGEPCPMEGCIGKLEKTDDKNGDKRGFYFKCNNCYWEDRIA
jgi:hypothetical protein